MSSGIWAPFNFSEPLLNFFQLTMKLGTAFGKVYQLSGWITKKGILKLVKNHTERKKSKKIKRKIYFLTYKQVEHNLAKWAGMLQGL